MSLHLLAFGPHPDDVELSCGGWLALASGRGQAVGVVDLTAGELATNGTVEVRASEAAAAAQILGVTVRENLGLPDGDLCADDPEQLAAIVGAIRRHRPQLALAPVPDERHPDHVAAGRLVEKAMFFAGVAKYRPDLGERFRPQRLIGYPQRHEVSANFVVDVSAVYDTKLAAIGCHESQFGGGEQTLINRPLALEAFAVRDRYWGATIGVTHGEPYRLGAPMPLADPVAHFAAHPAVPVLVPR